ncbi:NAD-dependent epimerase/dehydratase family protein, partial [Pseudomonas aeruginosa]
VAYGRAAFKEGVCGFRPGRPEPGLFRLGMAAMGKNFTLDINRAREYLDYDPRGSLWTALGEFCAWWRAQGF